MPENNRDICYRLLSITSERVEQVNRRLTTRSASVKRHMALLAELRKLQAMARESQTPEDWQVVFNKVQECRNYIIENRRLHPNFHRHMDDYDLYHMEAVDGLNQRDCCLDYYNEESWED